MSPLYLTQEAEFYNIPPCLWCKLVPYGIFAIIIAFKHNVLYFYKPCGAPLEEVYHSTSRVNQFGWV